MACDPNELIEQAKCLNACIPQGMLPAVNTSLLCQILEAGGGGGGEFVLKTGDTMTGVLQITVPAAQFTFGINNLTNDATISYQAYNLFVTDFAGNNLIQFDGAGIGIAFFGGASTTQRTSGANLTNNVTVGGVNDTIADFTSLTVYATDAVAIRNDIYQLARKLKQINDGLRAYGLFT